MVKPKKKFTEDARVTSGFADISGFFARDTQHDAKETFSRKKKYCATLSEKLAGIDQLAKAKKYLRAPDLRVRSK